MDKLDLKNRIELKFAKKLNLYLKDSLWCSDDNLDLSNMNLTRLPLKFGKIKGTFYCENNQLTNLNGCPSSIGGSFWCMNNQLTSLSGCPSSIRGNLRCENNRLTNLNGCPSSIGEDFYCENNLVKLEKPENVECTNFYN